MRTRMIEMLLTSTTQWTAAVAMSGIATPTSTPTTWPMNTSAKIPPATAFV